MQTSLPPDLVPTGSSNLLMFVSTSCSVFLALGQVIFQKGLVTRLSDVVTPDLAGAVISAGATNFRSVVPASDLPAVVEAYGKSCTEVFVSYPPRGAVDYAVTTVYENASIDIHEVPSCRRTSDRFHLGLRMQVDIHEEVGGCWYG